VTQRREKNCLLHQFALYPSKGFGPQAQLNFAIPRARPGRRQQRSTGRAKSSARLKHSIAGWAVRAGFESCAITNVLYDHRLSVDRKQSGIKRLRKLAERLKPIPLRRYQALALPILGIANHLSLTTDLHSTTSDPLRSKPGRMSQHVSISRTAVHCPMRSVAAISPPSIKPEAGNDEKDVTPRGVNGDPPPRPFIPIFPKLVRRVWRLQPANRVQNIRGRTGAIVSRIVKRSVASAIPIRSTNDIISGSNCLLHR
jgi:hypothetical protein